MPSARRALRNENEYWRDLSPRDRNEYEDPSRSSWNKLAVAGVAVAGVGLGTYSLFRSGHLKPVIKRGLQALSRNKQDSADAISRRLTHAGDAIGNRAYSWWERPMIAAQRLIGTDPTPPVTPKKPVSVLDRVIGQLNQMKYKVKDPSQQNTVMQQAIDYTDNSILRINRQAEQSMIKNTGYRHLTVKEGIRRGVVSDSQQRELRGYFGAKTNEFANEHFIDPMLLVDEMGQTLDLRGSRDRVQNLYNRLEKEYAIPFLGYNPLEIFYGSKLMGWQTNRQYFGVLSGDSIQPTITNNLKELGQDHFFIGNTVYNYAEGRLNQVAKGSLVNSQFGPETRIMRMLSGRTVAQYEDMNPADPWFKKVGYRTGELLHLGRQDVPPGRVRELSDLNITKGSGPDEVLGHGLWSFFRTVGISPPGKFEPLRKSFGPTDFMFMPSVKSYNESPNLTSFLEQFYAKRDRVNELNKYSMAPYQFFARINEALGRVGLALPTQDLGSTGAIFGNLLSRRVLPVVGGIEAWKYINYEADNLFGFRPHETLADAYVGAQVDIAHMRETTGITDWFSDMRPMLPGFEEFEMLPIVGPLFELDRTADETLDHYLHGVEAVRSGRMWPLGSSPIQGGRVDRYVPTIYRQMKSQAMFTDNWLGEEDEYFAHSWLPTPRHPFAPLQRWFGNPYWHEERTYYDRPAPLTGGLPEFEEFPVFGPIVNSTVGQIIKPQRRMHPEFWEAYERGESYGAAAPIMFGPGAIGTDGSLQGMAYHYNQHEQMDFPEGTVFVDDAVDAIPHQQDPVPAIIPVDVPLSHKAVSASGFAPHPSGQGVVPVPTPDIPGMSVAYVTPSGNIEPMYVPMELIPGINQSLQSQSASRAGMVPSDEIPMATFEPEYLEGHPNAGQMLYNMQVMGGFYGFGLRTMTGDHFQTPKLATSSAVYSPTRQFWSWEIGRLGAQANEIGRRFIPRREYWRDYNPIPNTQPSWIPGDDYFQPLRTGDPYCVSPSTLIEVNGSKIKPADEIEVGDIITTHKGNLRSVDAIKKRQVNQDEKVFKFSVSSLPAFPFEVSEEHPILVKGKGLNYIRRSEKQVPFKKYFFSNKILSFIEENGVLSKTEMAAAIGISQSYMSYILNFMEKDKKIFRSNRKAKIEITDGTRYDLDLIQRELQWVKAESISVGDYVAYPLPSSEERSVTIDMKNHMPAKSLLLSDSIYYKTNISEEFSQAMKYIDKHGYPNFENKIKGKWLKKRGWDYKHLDRAHDSWKNKKDKKNCWFPRYIEVTPDLCALFGYWVAEGWVSSDKGEPCGIQFVFHKKETEYVDEVCSIIENLFGVLTIKRKKENVICISAFSKPLGELFKNLFSCGARNKSIPSWMFDLNKNCKTEFLRGLFNGDGCFFKKGPRFRVSLKTSSKQLAFQVRLMLLQLGVISGIIEQPPKNSYYKGKEIKSGTAYSVNANSDQGKFLGNLLGYTDFDVDPLSCSNTESWKDDKYLYLRVKSVQEAESVTEVIGFEVGVDDSFCVAGVATHNTKLRRQGELRLPGAAYEAIWDLPEIEAVMNNPELAHLVESGEINRFELYNPITRLRILSDAVPWSNEYKQTSRMLSEMPLTEEEREEVKQIRQMAQERKKPIRLYPYQFKDSDVDLQQVTVTRVLSNNDFLTLEFPDNPIRLAGVRVPTADGDELADEASKYLLRHIRPGKRLTIGHDPDPLRMVSNDSLRTIRAVVYSGNTNLNMELIRSGLGNELENDYSPAAVHARFTDREIQIGSTWESFAHMDNPIKTKLMQVRSPLESYERRDLYGKDFSTWWNPWRSFVVPTYESFIQKNPFTATITGAIFGSLFGRTGQAKMIGASLGAIAVGGGAVTRAIQERVSGENFIPRRRQREWETNEYLDIIKYIRNMRQFTEYADLARKEEGINVYKMIQEEKALGRRRKNQVRRLEDLKHEIQTTSFEPDEEYIQRFLRENRFEYEGASTVRDAVRAINARIREVGNRAAYPIGPYSAMALKAHEEVKYTMYNYDGGHMAGALGALPKNVRKYMSHFINANEEDRERLKETTPAYMQRLLGFLWGEGLDDKVPLEEYFQDKTLPGPEWAGWDPSVPWEAVRTRIIQSQNLDPSDMDVWQDDRLAASAYPVPIPKMDAPRSQSAGEIRRRLLDVLGAEGYEFYQVDLVPGRKGIQIDLDYVQDRRQEAIAYMENHLPALF